MSANAELNQQTAKEAVEDITSDIEWSLYNHHWALTGIDEEAYAIIE